MCARGALIGAVEWIIAGLAILVLGGKVFVQGTTGARSSAEVVGAEIEAGLFSMTGLAVCVSIALVCLLVYFLANRIGVEFQEDQERLPCAECGEVIPAVAQKCRFCGAAGKGSVKPA